MFNLFVRWGVQITLRNWRNTRAFYGSSKPTYDQHFFFDYFVRCLSSDGAVCDVEVLGKCIQKTKSAFIRDFEKILKSFLFWKCYCWTDTCNILEILFQLWHYISCYSNYCELLQLSAWAETHQLSGTTSLILSADGDSYQHSSWLWNND